MDFIFKVIGNSKKLLQSSLVTKMQFIKIFVNFCSHICIDICICFLRLFVLLLTIVNYSLYNLVYHHNIILPSSIYYPLDVIYNVLLVLCVCTSLRLSALPGTRRMTNDNYKCLLLRGWCDVFKSIRLLKVSNVMKVLSDLNEPISYQMSHWFGPL